MRPGATKEKVEGDGDPAQVSTFRIERDNPTMRMRRIAR